MTQSVNTPHLSLKWTPSYGEACYYTQQKVVRKTNFRMIGHIVFFFTFLASFFFANLFASQEFRKDPILLKMEKRKPAYEVVTSIVPTQLTGPRVTIIVDDVGQDISLLEELQKVTFPITVSVLPDTPFCAQSADWAFEHGIEVMVHLPMEPLAYPAEDPGRDALMCKMNPAQLQLTASKLLDAVPHAVGTNNHMGSRFTENRVKMETVLDVISKKHFYFIDSRTTANSIGFELAKMKHIPSTERTLFLDDEHDTQSVEQRFAQLVQAARKDGSAVGICHLKPRTIAALEQQNPHAFSDVRFTFASESVSR
jgi:polysaccharide deacetylase 2 family uncharacterized protein YibQ